MTAKIILEIEYQDFVFRVYNDKPNFSFLELKQVHGNTVLSTSKEKPGVLKEADGLICPDITLASLPFAIKTADCIPLLLINNKTIALLHAGWRGVAQKIQLIPDFIPQEAFIGPCIHVNSYEVSEEFKENFSTPLYSSCFKEAEEQIFFNLPLSMKLSLEDYYPSCDVKISPLNTFEEKELNSFRRDKTEKRNYNIVIPKSLSK